jgi:DNA segregation ATPase FtsK/SpoIIIE-like protein
VSEKETAAVVDFWKSQGQAEYVEGFLESPKDERIQVEGSNDDPDENDPMFDDAVRLVGTRRVSRPGRRLTPSRAAQSAGLAARSGDEQRRRLKPELTRTPLRPILELSLA